LYLREGKAITNFKATLPTPQSDLARQTLKDPYKFDFLNRREKHDERELEDALIDHVTKFLLELGAGFSYIGRQYKLEINADEFFIDLLFFFFKQKTAYEIRPRDWSSDVCSSDLNSFFLSIFWHLVS